MQNNNLINYAQITSLYSNPTYGLNLSLTMSGYFRISPGMQLLFWFYRHQTVPLSW